MRKKKRKQILSQWDDFNLDEIYRVDLDICKYVIWVSKIWKPKSYITFGYNFWSERVWIFNGWISKRDNQEIEEKGKLREYDWKKKCDNQIS